MFSGSSKSEKSVGLAALDRLDGWVQVRQKCDANLAAHGGFKHGFVASVKTKDVQRTPENFCVLFHNDKRTLAVSISEAMTDLAKSHAESEVPKVLNVILEMPKVY